MFLKWGVGNWAILCPAPEEQGVNWSFFSKLQKSFPFYTRECQHYMFLAELQKKLISKYLSVMMVSVSWGNIMLMMLQSLIKSNSEPHCLRRKRVWGALLQRNIVLCGAPTCAWSKRCCHPPQVAWGVEVFQVLPSSAPSDCGIMGTRGRSKCLTRSPNLSRMQAQLSTTDALPEAELGVRSSREMDFIFHLPAGHNGACSFSRKDFSSTSLMAVSSHCPFWIYQTNAGLVWKISHES